MKPFAKLAAVAAVTLSAAAFASSASAAFFVSIGTSGNPESHANMTWTGTGAGFGTLQSVVNDTATLYFTDPAFAAFSGLAGTSFTLTATADSGSGGSLVNNGTTLTQKGLDGSFEFKNGSTVLLHADFVGGWIQGAIGANSANFNNSSGVATFSSDVPGLLNGLFDDSFGFSLTGLDTNIASQSGHLKSFGVTTASGSFDAKGSVPEPATWGLRIVGFGGMGALLRSRRRQAALA
jgi:hypothetical protein